MNIFYLGTAASEGIPAMFCKCRICENARRVKGKEIKTRSGFLINKDLMIDFSADTNLNAIRFGLDLSALKYLLITHSHSDHFCFEDIFARNRYNSMNRVEPVLNMYGNCQIKKIYDTYQTDKDVSENLIPNVVKPYKEYNLGEYTIIPIKSIHMVTEESLVYIVKDKTKTYFHCMDTGLLDDESYEYIKNNNLKFDGMTIDFTFGLLDVDYYGHHNITRLLKVVDKLKEIGAVSDNTKIVACHVAHCVDNTHEEMEKELKKYNIELAYDGLEIEI